MNGLLGNPTQLSEEDLLKIMMMQGLLGRQLGGVQPQPVPTGGTTKVKKPIATVGVRGNRPEEY